MNITFILPGYPNKPVGGFRVVYQYANEFVKKGHEVKIIHPMYMPNYPQKKILKVKTFIKACIKRIIYKVYTPQKPIINWQEINPKIKMIYVPTLNEKYIPDSDVIIATAWHTAEYVVSYSNRKGEKFYFIQHYETWSGPKERVDKTWLFPLKKIVIANWLKELGEELGAENLKVVPNAIEHKKFFLTNKIENRPHKVAMLYHYSDWKGSAEGIKALEIVKEKVPELQAVLFGVPERGPEIPDWIEYIQTPEQEILRDYIYNQSSIFLCASWSEGWGLPASEAMACGCAVVSTENGGVRDFAIHNETALLSPIKDSHQLANHILQLINDSDQQVRMAYSGYKYIQKFNYQNSSTEFEKYLIENYRNNNIVC